MDAFEPLETHGDGGAEAFRQIRDAQLRSKNELDRLITGCATVELPPDAVMVVSGSLARHEFTAGSDLDCMLVGIRDELVMPSKELEEALDAIDDAVVALGYRRPSRGGPFGGFVQLAKLRHVGGESDGNEPLTRRMSLLLESAEVGASGLRDRCVADVIDHYLQEAPDKNRRPPRFLLNDIVRYWRTMCVDYEGKLRRASDEKWALRNAKLRTSRKMLFAGGAVSRPGVRGQAVRGDEGLPDRALRHDSGRTGRCGRNHRPQQGGCGPGAGSVWTLAGTDPRPRPPQGPGKAGLRRARRE